MSSSEGPPPEGIEDQGDLLADIDEETAKLKDIARRILEVEGDGEIPDALVQESITALTRLYTVKFQMGERWRPFVDDRPMPPTSVMIMSTAMLRAVNVELFEVGMWQAWSGV